MTSIIAPEPARPLARDVVDDPVIADVQSIRRQLTVIRLVRTVLQAAGAAFVSWVVVRFAAAHWFAGVMSTSVGVLSGALAAVVAAVVLLRRDRPIDDVRTALWIEEHGGGDFALVTWVEQAAALRSTPSLLAGSVARRVQQPLIAARAAIPRRARTRLLGPALFLLGAVFLALGEGEVSTPSTPEASRGVAANGKGEKDRARPFAAWRVRVVPPAYTRRPAQTLADVNSVKALSGSRVEIIGTDATPDSVRVRLLGDSTRPRVRAAITERDGGWTSVVIADDGPMDVRVARDRFSRLLLIEGVADSIPRAQLIAPVRDSVLRVAEGRLPLTARLHDDLGLARASFELVVSSGSGEQFTVRTQEIGATAANGARDLTLNASIDLAALKLAPGDMIHVRAVARDNHPVAAREPGTSETRAFRIARPSEYDSVAVEPAPPPDVDKSLLSQRMLLLLTERLEKRRPSISGDVLRSESRALAKDQGRLRQAVGDAVFQRLSGDAGGEHSHSADDGHDHGVEAVGGKLALSGVNSQGMLEEGDDSPVIAINKPLLEAYNAMWDAGRALEQGEPRAAIPFMRIALDAIERARAASRLYLRGKPPTVIIDLAKVRLVGKDTGAANTRIARAALPPLAAQREARLLVAAALVATDATAARDSLALLRLESLADAPAFAEALAALVARFGAERPTDITADFVRARRVLGGISREPVSPWSRGGPP